MLPIPQHTKGSVRLATQSATIAGLLHLFPSAITHLTPYPPLETIFFISIGAMQIIWAYEFRKHDTKSKYRFGLFLNGGAAILWILTRTLAAPFSTLPEHIGLLDSSVLALEVISVVGLLAWHNAIKQNVVNVVMTGFLTALISGSLFYGGARSLELVFPDRESAHGHEEVVAEDQFEGVLDKDLDESVKDSNAVKNQNSSIDERKGVTRAVNGVQTKDKHNNDDGHHD